MAVAQLLASSILIVEEQQLPRKEKLEKSSNQLARWASLARDAAGSL